MRRGLIDVRLARCCSNRLFAIFQELGGEGFIIREEIRTAPLYAHIHTHTQAHTDSYRRRGGLLLLFTQLFALTKKLQHNRNKIHIILHGRGASFYTRPELYALLSGRPAGRVNHTLKHSPLTVSILDHTTQIVSFSVLTQPKGEMLKHTSTPFE